LGNTINSLSYRKITAALDSSECNFLHHFTIHCGSAFAINFFFAANEAENHGNGGQEHYFLHDFFVFGVSNSATKIGKKTTLTFFFTSSRERGG
jgi:hypothetical protein